MDETMNIVDYKYELDKLTGNILNEYIKIENAYIQERSKSTDTLTDISSRNTSICEALQSKTDQIYGLEKEIEGYKSKTEEYIRVIDNLRKDLNKSKENDTDDNTTENNTNKFDMLRGQAKEISAKDKEIERLTKDISKLKEMNKMKQSLSMVVQDELVGGLSPTSSKGPPDTPNLDLNKKEADDEDSYFIITYRKNKYYRDNDNKVYSIEENEEVGACIGDWVKDVKRKGKHKLVKS